ncbi:MAG: glycosyl hydrolase family 18 protein [Candidatus Paceibacterota bacterium]
MRNHTKLLLLFLLTLFGALFSVSSASASEMERIFYYRDSEYARQSLYKNYSTIDILAPQFYAFGVSGALESEAIPEVVNFANSHGVKVMPLLTNKSFSQKGLYILDNEVAQNAAVIALVTEAKKMGYVGYQVDFEQMDASYKDRFTAFVSKLHQGLQKNGLILSVAVIAKISDDPSDYKAGLYQKLIGVYDYKALAETSDFVSIMSYDDPESKGPVARYEWLKDVLEYSTARIPEEKLSLGIPLYYWKWNNGTGKLVGIGGYEGLQNAFARQGIVTGQSPLEKSAFLSYYEQGATYMIWYEDATSLPHKLALIRDAKLRGFSAWALGLEVPAIHTIL